jgi:hypothetical protein
VSTSHRAALLVLLLALAGCAQPDQATEPQAAPAPPGPPPPRLALGDAAARLPPEAAGFLRGRILPLRAPAQGREPPRETGREVAYATGSQQHRAAALVQLLPAGPDLPDGPDSPRAVAAFEAELAEQVAGRDRARNLRETGRFPVTANGRPALTCARLAGTFGRQPVEGLVCGGAVGGNLVRLRVSMPSRQPPLADPRAFASAIVAALAAR